jgi:hypothetical protein
VEHDRRVQKLTDLTGRWWDWQVSRWDAAVFRLVADNDLTYHHCVEVTFTDAVWVGCADMFHHPVFRSPTPAEREFARQVIADESYQVFVWDAETAAGTVPMMVIARDVQVVEGLVSHTG